MINGTPNTPEEWAAWHIAALETEFGQGSYILVKPTVHPVEALWRKHGLPEWFLGNGGTNTKLYALYDDILRMRAPPSRS